MPFVVQPVPGPIVTCINTDNADPDDRLVITLENGRKLVFRLEAAHFSVDCDLERTSTELVEAIVQDLWGKRPRLWDLMYFKPRLTREKLRQNLTVMLGYYRYPEVTVGRPLHLLSKSSGLTNIRFTVPGGRVKTIESAKLADLSVAK